MKKSKVVLTRFIKDDQVDLNQYLMYLFKQFNLASQNQSKECAVKRIK